MKEINLEFANDGTQYVVSENLETYIKNKNPKDKSFCNITSCQVMTEKDKSSDNLEITKDFKVKATSNIAEGYNETIRLECKVSGELEIYISSEYFKVNQIQKPKKNITASFIPKI